MRPWPLAGLLALLLAGCGREQPPVRAVPAVVSLTEAAAAGYPGENGTLQLRDGRYEDGQGLLANLDEWTAQGDLDGDGIDDLAVILVTSTGGSGQFRDLYVLRRDQGAVQVSAPGFLGDRVVVNGLRIERGEAVVDLLVQGDDDPLCCPSLPVSYRFRLAGDKLVETTGRQRLYLQP